MASFSSGVTWITCWPPWAPPPGASAPSTSHLEKASWFWVIACVIQLIKQIILL